MFYHRKPQDSLQVETHPQRVALNVLPKENRPGSSEFPFLRKSHKCEGEQEAPGNTKHAAESDKTYAKACFMVGLLREAYQCCGFHNGRQFSELPPSGGKQ